MRASAAQPRLEQCLALLAALAARARGGGKKVGELFAPGALGILHVLLEPQHVAEALLREPDDVVVLVRRAGDLARLSACHRGPPSWDEGTAIPGASVSARRRSVRCQTSRATSRGRSRCVSARGG